MRRNGLRQVVNGHVIRRVELARVLDAGVGEQHLFHQAGQQLRAVRLHDHLVVVAAHRLASPLQAVVPHDLGAGRRNREGKAQTRAAQAIRVTAGEFRGHRVLLGGLVDFLRPGGVALGRVDIHLVGRVALEQLLVADRELVLVLGHVGLGDGEQRLLVRVGIGGIDGRRVALLRQAAGPGRDAAIRIGLRVSADRRQLCAQLGGLGLGNLGLRLQCREPEQGCAKHCHLLHMNHGPVSSVVLHGRMAVRPPDIRRYLLGLG
jgi:hypothetical protein